MGIGFAIADNAGLGFFCARQLNGAGPGLCMEKEMPSLDLMR